MPRRNGRGGRSAAENFIGALRCLYRQTEDYGLIDEKDNPVGKRSRRPRAMTPNSTRGSCGCTFGDANTQVMTGLSIPPNAVSRKVSCGRPRA